MEPWIRLSFPQGVGKGGNERRRATVGEEGMFTHSFKMNIQAILKRIFALKYVVLKEIKDLVTLSLYTGALGGGNKRGGLHWDPTLHLPRVPRLHPVPLHRWRRPSPRGCHRYRSNHLSSFAVVLLYSCLLTTTTTCRVAFHGPGRASQKHFGPWCARLLRLSSRWCSVGLLIWLFSAICTFAESFHFLLSSW